MNHNAEILDLIFESGGKAAPYITEKLSVIGDGKMAEGIKNLTDYAVQCGIAFGDKRGFKKGVALGAFGVSALFFAGKHVHDIHKNRRKQKVLLQKAVQNFDEGAKELQAEQITDDSDEKVVFLAESAYMENDVEAK